MTDSDVNPVRTLLPQASSAPGLRLPTPFSQNEHCGLICSRFCLTLGRKVGHALGWTLVKSICHRLNSSD